VHALPVWAGKCFAIYGRRNMSRIGKKPIVIPKGVDVKVDAEKISVKGPKGALVRPLIRGIEVKVDKGQIVVSRVNDTKELKCRHGLIRALVANMMTGVTEGFEKSLELVGVGYKAMKQGSNLKLQMGYSHAVEMVPPNGIEISVEGVNKIKVSGVDKELVGQTAANIREVRGPEPYKGKGIKYAGEVIRKKAGKVAKVGGAA